MSLGEPGFILNLSTQPNRLVPHVAGHWDAWTSMALNFQSCLFHYPQEVRGRSCGTGTTNPPQRAARRGSASQSQPVSCTEMLPVTSVVAMLGHTQVQRDACYADTW